MRRVVGVYSGDEYSIDQYMNGQVKECRLLIPAYVGDKEAYGYISNHRIQCNNCLGCPVKLSYISREVRW